MCISCMRGVSFEGTLSRQLHIVLIFPPSRPVMPITYMPVSWAFCIAAIIFSELPDVDMATKISFFLPQASIIRAYVA